MGMAYALVGGLKLSLAERLQIDEGKVGRLIGRFGTMFGPTILLCGFLTAAASGAVFLALIVIRGMMIESSPDATPRCRRSVK